MNQSGQSQFYDGEVIDDFLANLIDGCDQIIVADMLPRVRGSRQQVVGQDDLRGGSKIGSTVVGVGVVGAESIFTGLIISPSPSALMTQEIDLTVKIWSGFGEDEEPAKCTILFVVETACTPLPGTPTIDRILPAVLRGVSHEGKLIGRGARDQEQEGNRDT